tara:strand:- start:2064 stop:2450 length:387 start_codon:yes stop_codon:yes gene_type:complete
MDDYDNTNTGRLFKNDDDWSVIQTGKIDIDGDERRVIGIKRKNRNGDLIVEIYTAMGTLKPAEKRNDKSPDAIGVIENLKTASAKRMFARKKTSKNNTDYVALSFADLTDEVSQPEQNTEELNDEVPF